MRPPGQGFPKHHIMEVVYVLYSHDKHRRDYGGLIFLPFAEKREKYKKRYDLLLMARRSSSDYHDLLARMSRILTYRRRINNHMRCSPGTEVSLPSSSCRFMLSPMERPKSQSCHRHAMWPERTHCPSWLPPCFACLLSTPGS
jgi:hypothetical protein